MKIVFKNSLLFCFSASIILLNSCRPEEDIEDKTDAGDIVAAQEMTIADQLFGEMKNIADQGESGTLNSYKNGQPAFADCATVTVSQPQKKVIIDFGTVNCVCKDLRLRRGVLEITFTGNNYWDSGSVATIVPTNYFVNDHQLIGSKVITNLNNVSDNDPAWNIVVNGTVIKPNGGGSFQWESDRVHTWTTGNTTPFNWVDDEWSVEGSATLTASTAVEWNLTIMTPLHRALSCRWLDKGLLRIKRTGLVTDRFVDYGNGTCDDDAVYTANGIDYPFKLK